MSSNVISLKSRIIKSSHLRSPQCASFPIIIQTPNCSNGGTECLYFAIYLISIFKVQCLCIAERKKRFDLWSNMLVVSVNRSSIIKCSFLVIVK